MMKKTETMTARLRNQPLGSQSTFLLLHHPSSPFRLKSQSVLISLRTLPATLQQ